MPRSCISSDMAGASMQYGSGTDGAAPGQAAVLARAALARLGSFYGVRAAPRNPGRAARPLGHPGGRRTDPGRARLQQPDLYGGAPRSPLGAADQPEPVGGPGPRRAPAARPAARGRAAV